MQCRDVGDNARTCSAQEQEDDRTHGRLEITAMTGTHTGLKIEMGTRKADFKGMINT